MKGKGYLTKIKTSRVYHTKNGSYYYEYFLGCNIAIKVKVFRDLGSVRTDVYQEYQGKYEKIIHNFDEFVIWYKKTRDYDEVVIN